MLWATSQSSPFARSSPTDDKRIPVAILGDSDSHSYHDTISFPPDSPSRGGAFRNQTFQWDEILTALRGDYFDFGSWDEWGTRGVAARLQDSFGMGGRTPQKMDYRYNFALSGAVCDALGPGHMARQLVSLMNQQPDRWQRGVVIIRIGVNDVGNMQSLDALAHDPHDATLMKKMNNCVMRYKEAVELIHAFHPITRIVLVGLFDNSQWVPLISKWQDATSKQNILAGIDAFNSPLRKMVAADSRLAFFDDQAWFREQWGDRDANGKPNYKTVTIDGKWPTPNTQGDSPKNAVIKDGHAGTIWNLKWSQSLVALMNTSFQWQVPPLSEQELAAFLTHHEVAPW